MSPRRTFQHLLPLAALVGGCAESPTPPTELPRAQTAATAPDTGPLGIEPEPACATPRVETWTGTAGRTAEMYPDDIATEVAWRRVGSDGCVDHYAPAGGAR